MAAQKATLKIQLNKYFGQSVADEAIRQQFGQMIIDEIIKRTQSGIDKNGRPFKKYSKNYIKSLAFKAFNKSPEPVDLTLSGAMLGTMDILSSSANSIEFGWTDDLENAKAFNHTTGDTVPKRDFLGLPERTLKEMANSLKKDMSNKDNQQTAQFTERALAFLEFIRGQG